jgi:protein-disulfide isomerase
MFRRFFVISCKRTLLLFLMVCVGCSAQLAPVDLSQRIENRLRVSYNIPSDVKVVISAPRPSEFSNYDAIKVTFQGHDRKQDYDFLLSKDQKTLIRMTKMDLTKDPYQEIMSKINVKGRPVRGNPNAKVVVVNYDDFECPFCSQVHRILFPELLKEYGDRVAFIYKDFPLSEIHPWAIHAAVDANCLAAQSGDAYWDFADYIHSNQQVVNSEKGRDNQYAALDRITKTEADKFHMNSAKLQACAKDPESEAAVNASEKEGEALNVSGTPTMFVNGQMLDGARPISEIRAAFDSALQRAGVPVPAHAPSTAANRSQQDVAGRNSAVQR